MKKLALTISTMMLCISTLTACDNDDEIITQTEPEVVKPVANTVKPKPVIAPTAKPVDKNISAHARDVSLDDLDNILAEIETNDKAEVTLYKKKKEGYSEDNAAVNMVQLLMEKSFNHDLKTYTNSNQQKCFGKLNLNSETERIKKILKRQLPMRRFNDLTEFVKVNPGQQFPKYATHLLNGAPMALSKSDEENLEAYLFSDEGEYLSDLRFNKSYRIFIKNRTYEKLQKCGVKPHIISAFKWFD